jgi:hypothetical protein
MLSTSKKSTNAVQSQLSDIADDLKLFKSAFGSRAHDDIQVSHVASNFRMLSLSVPAFFA